MEIHPQPVATQNQGSSGSVFHRPALKKTPRCLLITFCANHVVIQAVMVFWDGEKVTLKKGGWNRDLQV